MCLWKNWSIQLFVLLGLIFQIILAVLGSRRKISSAKTIRFVIWASYPLGSYISTHALGKLTSVSLNKSEEEYDTELIVLLAPLTLLLLGNPDSITAYSMEDNWLGWRRVLNLIVTFPFVVWILVRSWKTSIRMILYFPMFVAGIIEYGETIWALYSAYDESTNMTPVTPGDFNEEKEMFFALLTRMNCQKVIPDQEIYFEAYYWFDCLKPHLLGRLKHPFFKLDRRCPINQYSPEDVFLITEMELGFTYGVLYTKAPVLYTKLGITLRVISYFNLLLTLGGFMGLFFDKFLRDPYVIYMFGLLIGVVLRETYQLLKLFNSDWVIIKITNHLENPMVLKFLQFLVKRSLKKERRSNRIWQFNFLDFCLSEKQPWHFKILKLFGKAEKFKRYWLKKSMQIPKYVKELLVKDMKKFEIKRDYRPFTKRGQWSLGAHESLDKLEWSIEMTFDRSIIIWHIATHVCYHSCHKNSNNKETSKLISDHMMFLLVHPQILSLTTAEITYHHTYTKLKTFLNKFAKENILKVLLAPDPGQECNSFEAVITKGWNVLEEARTLARELKSTKDTWQLVSSIWVGMLCFAAYNCQQYQHAKLLRQGGDIITHDAAFNE
ncbi:uncharacterized protein LOC115679543 [Syzygium oleosum]|uniref:uncharacterized protein LOC115679543 n=1 Tax=Syzygium oleosum TaxID=219896 RepID=UPI0024B8C08E|nr:uncharacterized protein LOC115679543 [Syzygium oleosum]